MAIELIDSATGKKLGIENSGPGNTGAARVVLYDGAGNPLAVSDHQPHPNKGMPVIGENDGLARSIIVDATGALSLDAWSPVFHDAVDGSALNTAMWTSAVTTFAVAQANRVITLNSGNSSAASANANITSVARFKRINSAPLRLRKPVRFVWSAGAQEEVGFGVPSAATAIADGVFLRIGTTGAVTLVVAYAGAEVAKDLGTTASLGLDSSKVYLLDLLIRDDRAQVILREHDATASTEPSPIVDSVLMFGSAQFSEYNAIALPVFARVFTGAGYSGVAPSISIGPATVLLGDSILNADLATMSALLAQTSHAVALGAVASTANYANSAAPASATLSNTVAGYATHGGQWQFAAVAGAETDFVLFGFAVPTGKRLRVRGMIVDAWVMGAASATTPTLLQWGLGRGTAASLANNQYRVPCGAQTIPVGTAIGGMADRRVDCEFDPFIVESGQFLQVILRVPVGSATASQIVRGVCTIKSVWI